MQGYIPVHIAPAAQKAGLHATPWCPEIADPKHWRGGTGDGGA